MFVEAIITQNSVLLASYCAPAIFCSPGWANLTLAFAVIGGVLSPSSQSLCSKSSLAIRTATKYRFYLHGHLYEVATPLSKLCWKAVMVDDLGSKYPSSHIFLLGARRWHSMKPHWAPDEITDACIMQVNQFSSTLY